MCETIQPLHFRRRKTRARVRKTEGPRRILHTGSRDFGSSANVACKTEEKDGGGEGTRARDMTARK